MRYYSITISDPNTGQSIVQDGNQGFTTGSGPTFSSLSKDPITGQMSADPGALNIEFDFPVTQMATPQGAFRIKVYGVGLRMISQAANLAGMNFSINAGMSPGLPLANPSQAGPIAKGNILVSYGNWQGVNQTLDLLVTPGTKEQNIDIPMPFWWPAGTSLDDAINAALTASFPGFKTQIFIDSNLILSNDEAGYYENFIQFASYLNGITLKLGSQTIKNYPGVNIVWNGDTITVYDGTVARGPTDTTISLDFQDLIGQPTWISPTQIGFSTVLRADIGVGNKIKFPTGIVTPYALTGPAAAAPGRNSPVNNRVVFQGEFLVNEIHHFGNFREPDPDSWQTAFVVTAP